MQLGAHTAWRVVQRSPLAVTQAMHASEMPLVSSSSVHFATQRSCTAGSGASMQAHSTEQACNAFSAGVVSQADDVATRPMRSQLRTLNTRTTEPQSESRYVTRSFN